MKKVFGLTGGIASGKSTVGKFFTGWGVKVIDADELARLAVTPGSAGLEAIKENFGAEYLLASGDLNREMLAIKVFSDAASLKTLNAIMHPLIAELAKSHIEEASKLEVPYIIYDAALHVEQGTYKDLGGLIVVATPKHLQLSRLMKRKGLSQKEALERIEAQLPLEYRLTVANYVIENDNNLDNFRTRAWAVHRQILKGL